MHELLLPLTRQLTLTGDIAADAMAFLTWHGFPRIIQHSQSVAEEACRLARRFHLDENEAIQAAWLHDISAVFPNASRLEAARRLGLDILPEEAQFPLLLHQKLSAVMAQQIFQVTSPAVLSAAGCHTTLKANASPLDKLIFVADKLQWDQDGTPPYLDAMRAEAQGSLEQAALAYIEYLVAHRSGLKGPLHPWLLAARQQLLEEISAS